MKNLLADLKSEKNFFVEVRSGSVLLSEGCSEIKEYSDKSVVLVGGNAEIKIVGENMTLRHLSKDRACVEGRIFSLEFL